MGPSGGAAGSGGGQAGARGMEAPEGPRRFQCPPDFSAAPFRPGPAFSEATLRGPSKQLWLIRAPAAFRPESLEGRTVPLLGLQTLKAAQPDGTQKIFGVQRASEDVGSARPLVPSGPGEQLTCGPPVSGSLSICERYGDPGGHQPLFPVAGRPAPPIPAGLKQRFLPFGSHPRRAPLPGAAGEPPRTKKKKKKKQRSEEPVPLSGTPWGEAPGASEAEAECRHKQEEGAALWAIGHPAEAQPCSAAFAQGSLLSGEVEEPSPRSKKKKRRKEDREVKQETGGEGEGLQEPSSSIPQPWLEGDPEAGGVRERRLPGTEQVAQDTRKGKRKRKDATSNLVIKEEVAGVSWDFGGLVATPESGLVLATEEPGVGSSAYKAKKKKKKSEETDQEQGGWPAQPDPGTIKQELESCAPLCTPSQGGRGQEAEPGLEGLSQRHKKKKKRHRLEAAEEGLAWPKQELGSS